VQLRSACERLSSIQDFVSACTSLHLFRIQLQLRDALICYIRVELTFGHLGCVCHNGDFIVSRFVISGLCAIRFTGILPEWPNISRFTMIKGFFISGITVTPNFWLLRWFVKIKRASNFINIIQPTHQRKSIDWLIDWLIEEPAHQLTRLFPVFLLK